MWVVYRKIQQIIMIRKYENLLISLRIGET